MRRWRSSLPSGTEPSPRIDLYFPGTTAYRGAWQETIAAAEEYNDPGRFTAFIGYEWTSNTGGNNLHRNVIFRDNGDKASQVEPFTVYPPMGSDNPRQPLEVDGGLRKQDRRQCARHRSQRQFVQRHDVSDRSKRSARSIDRQYAETRLKWERLYETTQIKGDGEAHPFLSPNDEFANFERWDKGNLDGSVAKTKDMLEFEYARSALKNGLKLEKQLGANPYKFGLVGSSDAHNALSALEEDNFFGKTVPQEPSAERTKAAFIDNKQTGVRIMDWEVSASGYAAVWAMENTRESIWDAMERRETYATTGPRMAVRLFGGWDFTADDANTRNPAVAGYTKGVPMGGDLTPRPKARRRHSWSRR